MRSVTEELATLVSDLESFICEGLKGENLSKKAKERREVFIRRIKEVKLSFPHDFKEKNEEESDIYEDDVDSADGGSQQSERTDKDEEASETSQQSPPVAAQDLPSVVKAGYLEKRRKDHSFFGNEWQKRWCALSQNTFYYYGHEKDKQQKGEFSIDGYNVKIVHTLRKDSKKDCCFEISAPDKRVYQFCASSVKEANDWVKQIDFVLRDMSGMIPEEEDEAQDLLYDSDVPSSQAIDEDIYEELPEEDLPTTVSKPTPVVPPMKAPVAAPPMKAPVAAPPTKTPAADKSKDYPNYYQGMWDCLGDRPDELTFKRGEAIYILSKEYNKYGWWVGEKNGLIGIVPRDFLTELYVL